jgi:hypothetical protein
VKIDVLTGRPGAGKTSEMIEEMTGVPGRYLFASPAIHLMPERVEKLREKAAEAGTSPVIREVHSKALLGGVGGNVRRRIAEAPDLHAGDEHVILLAMHEGTMNADLSAYAGWHARIDEVPNVLLSGAFRVPVTCGAMAALYDLEEVAEGWWRIVPREGTPDVSAFRADDFLQDLAPFHRRARSAQGVFVNIGDWQDARARGVEVRWWSLWTPEEMAAFDSVAIAGSGFFGGVAHRAMERWCGDAVAFVPRPVGREVEHHGGHRRVVIRHFTGSHTGSTSFWTDTEDGRRCLLAVRGWLWENAPEGQFWSCNSALLPYLGGGMPGRHCQPKLAGTNRLDERTACTLVYSAKAQAQDETAMRLFGVTKEEVRASREDEDIKQFVMRGALRRAEFAGEYHVNLYDRRQAEMLREYLLANGVADEAVVEYVEVGIGGIVKPAPGRQKIVVTPQQEAERRQRAKEADRARKRREREEERAAKAADGTLRGRGRPRKEDGAEARP